MGLKTNVAAGYFSQFYVALVGIVITPVYLAYLGVEAYGLVGFFAMMMSWFQLLDVGLSPTMLREIARFRGGALDGASLRKVLHAIELLFAGIALTGGVAIAALAGPIAARWIRSEGLGAEEIRMAVVLMGTVAAVRLLSSLYRGAISGFERLAWLAGFSIATASARAFLVIPAFAIWGHSIRVYLTTQLIVALAEVLALMWQTYSLFPRSAGQQDSSRAPVRHLLRFSLGVALVTSLSTLVTQSDRLILSGLLTLEDFAYFSLATLVASSISLVSGPLGSALMPRLSRLAAGNEREAMLDLYRAGLQVMCVAVIPLAITVSVHADGLLWAWTGKRVVADNASRTLALYALGNSLAAVAALTYCLQFALGNLRWHMVGTAFMVVVLVPGQIYLARNFGATGAGAFWLAVNIAYVTLWIPFIHRKFAPEVTGGRYVRDLAPSGIASAIAVFAVSAVFDPAPQSRAISALQIAVVALVATLCAALATPATRSMLSRLFPRNKPLLR